jgi:hypothetical protein
MLQDNIMRIERENKQEIPITNKTAQTNEIIIELTNQLYEEYHPENKKKKIKKGKRTIKGSEMLWIWQTIRELPPIMIKGNTNTNSELLRWMKSMLKYNNKLNDKAYSTFYKNKEIEEDKVLLENFNTSSKEFFRKVGDKGSGGYHHTSIHERTPEQDENEASKPRYHIITHKKGILDAMCNYWRDLYNGVKKPQTESPIYKEMFQNRTTIKLKKDLESLMKQATIEEYQEALSKCNDNTAVGPDKTAYCLFKHGNQHVTNATMAIINSVLKNKKIIDQWRHARIILIEKDVEKPSTSLDNHRPISLTSCLQKITERIISKRITTILEKHNALPENQWGGRANRSPDQPINIIADIIEEANQNKKPAFITAWDFKKCFDSVQWQCVEDGMKALGFPEDFIEFYKDSCKNRTASFVSGFGDSQKIDIKSSVFQGTVLSGLLFNIAVAGMSEMLSKRKGVMIPNNGQTEPINFSNGMFVDDTITVSSTIEGIQELAYLMYEASEAMGMTLNGTKTVFAVAGLPDDHPQNYTIRVGPRDEKQEGTTIKQKLKTEHWRYLGVQFRTDSNWIATEEMITEKIEKYLAKMHGK